MDNNVVTVSQINTYINNKMKSDENLSEINIRGELSNYKNWHSGHSYFTLKDEKSEIPGVMFSGYKKNLKFEPKNGMKVIINGHIEVYKQKGRYQVHAHKITEDGLGDLHIAFEQLKIKLEKEGLFDKSHKKKIPTFPKRIGVVTARSGAAIRDIITTINRRYPLCEIIIFSTLVQGELAKYQIVNQIKKAQNYNLDTLIVGRGGGSIEDLWPFNEEMVARAIYDCEIPVISAVGHEIDFTISDFVSDKRAATPTAAAELAVPDMVSIKYRLDQISLKISRNIEDRLIQNRNKLDELSNKQIFRNPELFYDMKKMYLDNIIGRFDLASKEIISENRKKLFKIENSIVLKNPDEIIKHQKDRYLKNLGKLEVLNPMSTLKRGYSIAKKNDKIISSIKDVSIGDELEIKVDDGTINTKVI